MYRVSMSFHATLLAGLVAGILGSAGCNDDTTLEERYTECADLVADKDAREASLDCFTPKSRAILAGLMRETKTSKGQLDALGRYRKLLDFEEVVAPAEIYGSLALLRVRKGRTQQTVIFELDPEDGKWRIDALELTRFWAVFDSAAGRG